MSLNAGRIDQYETKARHKHIAMHLSGRSYYIITTRRRVSTRMKVLKESFLRQPFISSYAKSVADSPRFFGETKKWIQSNCTDDPAPHRRELTDRIKNLFSWFSLLYPEKYILSRPNYSQRLEHID